jgi:thiamine biosynthesis lipoprotein
MVLIDSTPIRERIFNSATVREEGGLTTLHFHAMGTRCRVSLVDPSRKATNDFLQHLLEWVSDFEAKYSRFLDTSLISQINRAAGQHPVEIDEETDRILSLCAELHFFTQRVFDPTALPLIRLWDWKKNPGTLPSADAIARTKELVGWNLVQRSSNSVFLPRAGMCLDFGGIGKEYAVDMAMQIGASYGVNNLLVDFGQDLRVNGAPSGKPAWHIGLEDPNSPGTCWGSVAATDRAIATSGDYLRHFTLNGRRYGHILDPRSGYPAATECLAVSIVAPSCTMAGILSTSAFILGPKAGYDLINRTYGVAGAILTHDQRIFSQGFYQYLVNS